MSKRKRAKLSGAGFSLVELMVVVTLIGILLGFAIPAYMMISSDQQLRGACQDVAGQIQLARSRAMTTGVAQTLNFDTGSNPPRVFILDATNSHAWKLPNGITFVTGNANSFQMTNDGRASSSQYVVIQNTKGRQDTVSVQLSGLVLVR